VTWYFAYGSNLWIDQMIARTGAFPKGAEKPSIARLSGYRLSFNMRAENGQFYANITQDASHYVLGVLYPCTAEALDRLDGFEGGYCREQIAVAGACGATVEAVTYIAKAERLSEDGMPSAQYLQRILRGGRQHGLPEDYLGEIEKCAAERQL
jgi:gamma-glutamylcyclotransferase